MTFNRPTRKIQVDPDIDFDTDKLPDVAATDQYGFDPAILGSPTAVPRKVGTLVTEDTQDDHGDKPTATDA